MQKAGEFLPSKKSKKKPSLIQTELDELMKRMKELQRDTYIKLEISWDKDNPKEVALAGRRFREYTQLGFIAIIKNPNNINIQVYSFDPKFEKLILISPIAGG